MADTCRLFGVRVAHSFRLLCCVGFYFVLLIQETRRAH